MDKVITFFTRPAASSMIATLLGVRADLAVTYAMFLLFTFLKKRLKERRTR